MRRIGIIFSVSMALVLAAPLVFAQEGAQQVNVSAKIIEFKTSKGMDTGLTAYFKRHVVERDDWGRIVMPDTVTVSSADMTFPTLSTGGITVFLDRIGLGSGDVEMTLQALVDEKRAFVLSKPRALVTVASAVPTVIKTAQSVPYENTQVVGATAVQIISFHETGVSLNLTCPSVIDDDGDPLTTDDIYIQLNVTAEVVEPGLQVKLPMVSVLGTDVEIPEFSSRNLTTTVWVRHGQVLILGGLFRNSSGRSIASLPWLAQGEDFVTNAVGHALSVNMPSSPATSSLGSRHSESERRELVFMIKAELWRESFGLTEEFRFEDLDSADPNAPADAISGVVSDAASAPAPDAVAAAPAPAPAADAAAAAAAAPAPAPAPAPAADAAAPAPAATPSAGGA